MLAALAALFLTSPPLAREADDRDAWLRRVEAGRRDYELYATRALEDFAAQNAAFRRPVAPPPPGYAEDPTLRPGDVVMTEAGMLIYSGAPDGAARFTTLEAWRGDARRRADLLQLQKASLAEAAGRAR